MAKAKKREFGKVPGWALTGNVILRNYDLRAEFHMANSTKPTTPYLRRPDKMEEGEETADYPGWMQYFLRHLGGLSRQVRMFVEGYIPALNVPENTPEEFDPNFKRLPIYNPPLPTALEEVQWRMRAESRPFSRGSLVPTGSMFTGNSFYNVFVPTFAPQFEAMRQAGGIPGNTCEGKTIDGRFILHDRKGVWVPHKWLDQSAPTARAKWQPFTPEQLKSLYGRTQPTPERP